MYTAVLGGFTRATVENLQVSERRDVIDRIDSVWATADSLSICLHGTRIETNTESQYGVFLPGPSLPAMEDARGVRLSPLRDILFVNRERLVESCRKTGSQMMIQRAVAESNYVMSADNFVRTNPNLQFETSLIEFGPDSGSKGLIAVLPDGETVRAVRLDVKGVDRPGSKWWLALLPLAVVADSITYPVQLMMWGNYAGSH